MKINYLTMASDTGPLDRIESQEIEIQSLEIFLLPACDL